MMNTVETLSAFAKETFDLRDIRKKQAEQEVRAKCQNGVVSLAFGISALHAAWRAFFTLPPDQPVSTTCASPDALYIANHLSWLCNSAIGIRDLAFQGLEPQARVLLRSLLEAIYQSLVLFYDEESRIAYARGWTNSASKEAYYRAFAKKGRLHKKVQKIEDELYHVDEADRAKQLKQRLDMLESYSQATHGSFPHILTSALQPNSVGDFSPTILGGATIGTDNTLLNCSHEICYFAILFDHIVRNKWKNESIASSCDYKLFYESASLAALCRTHKYSSNERPPAQPSG